MHWKCDLINFAAAVATFTWITRIIAHKSHLIPLHLSPGNRLSKFINNEARCLKCLYAFVLLHCSHRINPFVWHVSKPHEFTIRICRHSGDPFDPHRPRDGRPKPLSSFVNAFGQFSAFILSSQRVMVYNL